jgi:hypothetical protein
MMPLCPRPQHANMVDALGDTHPYVTLAQLELDQPKDQLLTAAWAPALWQTITGVNQMLQLQPGQHCCMACLARCQPRQHVKHAEQTYDCCMAGPCANSQHPDHTEQTCGRCFVHCRSCQPGSRATQRERHRRGLSGHSSCGVLHSRCVPASVNCAAERWPGGYGLIRLAGPVNANRQVSCIAITHQATTCVWHLPSVCICQLCQPPGCSYILHPALCLNARLLPATLTLSFLPSFLYSTTTGQVPASPAA